jgi:hypothetical protein
MQESSHQAHKFDIGHIGHILQIKKETTTNTTIMTRKKSRVRKCSQGQRWLNTRLSEDVNSLTATATLLELEGLILPSTSEGPDVANNEESSDLEPDFDTRMSPPNSPSSSVAETDGEFESEEAPVNISTTVAQQVQMQFGLNNTASVSDNDHNNHFHNTNNEPYVKLSPVDCATLDVLKLCHDAGVSLEFYDILFALLRKHSSKNKVDVTKLPKRDTFLKSLRARISSPVPIISQVGNLQVPHFDILSQIRDLLGSFVFNDLNNLCVNMDREQRYKVFTATDDDKFVEMCAQKWYKQTYTEFVKDPQKQFLLPLIFYIDETGTDVFQRYPLEPLMFTFGILRNFIRERSSSWRHAGFIPKVAKAKSAIESLQLYHDCMAMVLSTLKPLQDDPPLEWLQFGDEPPVQKELILQVCFLMGDQKSQDNIVGRKLNNSGWAGRSHRGCMCSGPSSSDPCLRCQPVPIKVVHKLRDISFTSNNDSPLMEAITAKFPLTPLGRLTKKAKEAHDFVKRRAGLAREILGDVFTMHPLRNAWNPIGFGANKNGISSATLDDPMHFNESGLFDGVTKSFYGCFTEEELKTFEETTRSLYQSSRSSVRSDYPKSRISKGFTSCTLKTANETVGSLVSVALTVQDDKVFDMMDQVGKRQQQRYLTFPVNVASTSSGSVPRAKNSQSKSTQRKKQTKVSDKVLISSKMKATDIELLDRFPSRRNYTFGRDRTNDAKKEDFPRTNKSCRLLFKHIRKHGLGFVLDLELDEIQMEYLLIVSWRAFAGIDFSNQFYPQFSLQDVIPVFPFPESSTKKRMERYYKGHLHRKDTLRSTNRGGVVTISWDDVKDHTYQDESDESEEQQPSKRRKLAHNGKQVPDRKSNQNGPITTTISFPGLRSSKGVKKHGRIKPYTKGTGSTSAVLCDVKPYVHFIELALCLHAYLHYSKDLTLDTRCKPEIFDRGIREFLRLFNEYVYRGDDSVDTDTCKIHCHLHIMENILNFGDPMQYDAAKGERGLKDWAKQISQTAQKCGIDIFLFQTIHRVSTQQLMQRAQQLELWQKREKEKSNPQTHIEASTPRPVMNRKLPHFRYKTRLKVLYAVDRKGNEALATEKTGLVDKRILSKIERDHQDLEEIDIWGEIYLTTATSEGGQLLRGHPTLDRFGEMFDWVAVTFDTAEPSEEGLVGPAKILAFYKDNDGVERAVVHATNVTTGRETKAGNTLLIQNVRLEFNPRGFPALRTIRVDQIDRGIMAFEHTNFDGPLPPTINYSTEKSKFVVSCFVDRADWAYQFYDWANSLPVTNTQQTRAHTDEEPDTDTDSVDSGEQITDSEDGST